MNGGGVGAGMADSAAVSIKLERREHIAVVRLSRPERLNAFDPDSVRQLLSTLSEVAHDRSIRAVVLTGDGSAFSAGGDVNAMSERLKVGDLDRLFNELTGTLEQIIRLIIGMKKPVIAAIPGVAAGGGLSLALACDWRIGSTNALLIPAFSGLGAVPDGGLTYFLPHFIGLGHAQELLFSQSRVPAPRARELGLLHDVVAPEELQARAWAKAVELAAGPTQAYAATKQLLVSTFGSTVESQLALERRYAVEAALGPEIAEGIEAFGEKRKPEFPPPDPEFQ
jgi:2-(1,2-epoxy-1,2-dihydrophenyl)acetyl-CoA isomerase